MRESVSQCTNDFQNRIGSKSQVLYQNEFHENIQLKLDKCQFQIPKYDNFYLTLFHYYITNTKLII